MIIVERITENINFIDISKFEADRVLLKHDELFKVHRKLKTAAGEEIALSLPAGSSLKDGDVLYRDVQRIIFVSLEEEKIIIVRPRGNLQWAKAAYNVGNMHQAAYLKEDGISIPFDESMLRVVKKLGMDYQVCMGRLDGQRTNIQREGAVKDHAHSQENSRPK